MSTSVVLSWREGVKAAADGDGPLVVQGHGTRVSLPHVDAALVDAFRQLEPPGVDEDHVARRIHGAGDNRLSLWYYYRESLMRRGLLCYSAYANGARLASLVAISNSFVSRPAQVVSGQRYVLSRFAYLRRENDEAVLESPLTYARVILSDCWTGALIGALAAPATIEELGKRLGTIRPAAVTAVLTLLLRGGMLAENGTEHIGAEDQDPALQTWAFHDLVFHARSRAGRFDAAQGATCRLAGKLPPPPALKSVPSGETRELYRPDLARIQRDDPPLAWVQEQRCSVREYDAERPISDRQLCEFLFRVARVKDCRQAEVATPHGLIRMDFAARPYPAGGGLYELEFYVVVNRCAHLEPGLHYYDPSLHRLIHLRGRTAEVEGLLQDASMSTGIPEANLQILLILAARFPRLAWKYESIAYSLILKDVGVIFQTMYLAATAMGLGSCAVGGGNADLFARAAGTDYCAESSVGEFLLGSKPPGPRSSGL